MDNLISIEDCDEPVHCTRRVSWAWRNVFSENAPGILNSMQYRVLIRGVHGTRLTEQDSIRSPSCLFLIGGRGGRPPRSYLNKAASQNVSVRWRRSLDESDGPHELERKSEQAARIASRVNDPTTVERLRAWIDDLKQKLRHRREARLIKQETTVRARELWEQNGRPSGHDLEFWLQAESEISERHPQ